MGVGDERDRLVGRIPEALAGPLGIGPNDVKAHRRKPSDADLVVSAAGRLFVIMFKRTATAAILAAVAEKTKGGRNRGRHDVLLVAVPFMGGTGRRLCEELGVNWIDLSGNARIVAPGLRVVFDGRPNRFPVAGRPPNLFAPKSSRVVRWLLMHLEERLTQRQLARATDMNEGFVSRIVRRLEREGYLTRDAGGAVRPGNPAFLLDAWRDAYRFSRHGIRRGHVAARTGDALLAHVCDTFAARGIEHAATGLCAAWVLTRHAAFRITTVYVAGEPPPSTLEKLGYREDPRGANLWLAVPNDEGVFHGAAVKDGIRCAHPVQVYLDLKEHPERAQEAAQQLRRELLAWSHHGR